jgi:hypothetical protein
MTSYTASGFQLPLTIPDLGSFKASMLRTILSRAGIAKNDFLDAYYKEK